jgi:hypothetical protein
LRCRDPLRGPRAPDGHHNANPLRRGGWPEARFHLPGWKGVRGMVSRGSVHPRLRYVNSRTDTAAWLRGGEAAECDRRLPHIRHVRRGDLGRPRPMTPPQGCAGRAWARPVPGCDGRSLPPTTVVGRNYPGIPRRPFHTCRTVTSGPFVGTDRVSVLVPGVGPCFPGAAPGKATTPDSCEPGVVFDARGSAVYTTVSVPVMPAAAWPATVQWNS